MLEIKWSVFYNEKCFVCHFKQFSNDYPLWPCHLKSCEGPVMSILEKINCVVTWLSYITHSLFMAFYVLHIPNQNKWCHCQRGPCVFIAFLSRDGRPMYHSTLLHAYHIQPWQVTCRRHHLACMAGFQKEWTWIFHHWNCGRWICIYRNILKTIKNEDIFAQIDAHDSMLFICNKMNETNVILHDHQYWFPYILVGIFS